MAKTIHDIDPIMQFFTQERLRKRLTQQQVAERAGVSLRMLQRLEQGERVVDIAQIRRISTALEISVGHMIMHGAVSSPEGKQVDSLPAPIRDCLIELIKSINDEIAAQSRSA